MLSIDRDEITRLTFGLNARSPQWSPDGKFLSFSCTKDDKIGIYNRIAICLLNLENGEISDLTDKTYSAFGAVWRPRELFLAKDSSVHLTQTPGIALPPTENPQETLKSEWAGVMSNAMIMFSVCEKTFDFNAQLLDGTIDLSTASIELEEKKQVSRPFPTLTIRVFKPVRSSGTISPFIG